MVWLSVQNPFGRFDLSSQIESLTDTPGLAPGEKSLVTIGHGHGLLFWVCSTLENHEITYFALVKIRGIKKPSVQ
jgi:hypothetical protein